MGSIRDDGSDKFFGMENVSLPRNRIETRLTDTPRALVRKHMLLQFDLTMSLLLCSLSRSRD